MKYYENSEDGGECVKDKELSSRIGPVLLWSVCAAVLAGFVFQAIVLEAAKTYSDQLFLDLHGKSMANPSWKPWWGATLLRWASVYAAVIHGLLVGMVTYLVVSIRNQRKNEGNIQ